MAQLAALDAPEMNFEEYVSSEFYDLALLNFLDQGDPCMDAFRRRLCKNVDEKISHLELLDWLQTEQSVEKLVLLERAKANEAFMMEAEESAGGYEMRPGDIDHENVKDFDMPTAPADGPVARTL